MLEEKRTMGLKDLVLSGLCIMAPLAPFTAYYQIADASFGMVALVYLICLVAMIFIGMSFSQLSKEFPVAGSAYAYVQRSLNPHVGFMAGWSNLCLYLFIPGFIYIVSTMWLTELVPSVPAFVWLIVFFIINLTVNIIGASITTKLNNIIFWIQIGLITLFVGLSAKAVFIDGVGFGGFSLEPLFQAEHFSISFIAVAISLAIFGFVGFDTIGALADDAKNPKKDIGKAALIAVGLSGTLFFAQAYMAGLVVPDYTTLNPDTALFDVARIVGGEYLFTALLLVNIFAYGITIPINIQAAVSRIIFTMSRDDLIPGSKFFIKESTKFKTPINSIITVNVLTLLFALFLDFDMLMSAVNICAVVMYILLNIAVIYHFLITKKERNVKSIILNGIFPVIGLVISIYLLTCFGLSATILASVMLFIGLVIGAIKSNFYKKEIKIEDI